MSCHHGVNSLDDGFQLIGWEIFTLVTLTWGLHMCWNPKWWAVLRGNTGYVPSEIATQAAVSVFALAAGWGAWRLWFCNNWDIKIVPLLLYVVMIFMVSAFFAALSLSPTAWAPLAVALVATGIAGAYTGFAFVTDIWAGVTGIVGLLVCLYAFFLSVYLLVHQTSHDKDAYAYYASERDNIEPTPRRGITGLVADMGKPAPAPISSHMGGHNILLHIRPNAGVRNT